jgi:hypothetical protein
MVSASLVTWRSSRLRRLDRLRAAHEAFGSGPGRRWETEELNHALVLRLASEFQGFARDLHNEALDAVVLAAARSAPGLETPLRSAYVAARRLDRGNADPGTLDQDFGLFGVKLWADLESRYPGRCAAWNRKLDALCLARNGIAHDDRKKLAMTEAWGWPITLRSVDRWRSALNGLTQGMDHVVGEYLSRIIGASPW